VQLCVCGIMVSSREEVWFFFFSFFFFFFFFFFFRPLGDEIGIGAAQSAWREIVGKGVGREPLAYQMLHYLQKLCWFMDTQ
jgi:hypothetical protein